MSTSSLSRLSPYNIADDLLRSDMYREIRAGDDSWPEYEINPDEVLRPELIAYRHYGSDALKWVILIAAGMDNMRDAMEVGIKIKLPPTAWVRERIKFYTGSGA